jgi:HTH-type transcriptional regulator, sugar sensing transcriptional regulator
MDKETLKQLGFLDAEIDIYVTLLRLGPSKVSRLHHETGLHRTHIYDLLEKLKQKGLVSTFIQSGKKHFNAAPPSKILSYIEEKKEIVKGVLPELEELSKLPREETTIELFKGKEGLKTVLQDVLKTKKDYVIMGGVKPSDEILKYAMPQFLKKVEKNNIKERVISDKKEEFIKIKTGEYKYLKSEYLFPSSFWVYGEKVALFIWQMPYYVIIINNKHLAETYQNYFEFFWNLVDK